MCFLTSCLGQGVSLSNPSLRRQSLDIESSLDKGVVEMDRNLQSDASLPSDFVSKVKNSHVCYDEIQLIIVFDTQHIFVILKNHE